jgi:Bacterial capsule synthesis protein PGA_cap
MRSRYLFLSLLGILLFQIVSLRPELPFPTIMTGEIASAVRKAVLSVAPTSEQTDFAVQRTSTYDSLVFVGDVMLGRHVEFLMNTHGSDYPYRSMPLQALSPNPAIIGNFEASMAHVHVQAKPMQMRFSVDADHLDALHSAGFSHVSLANNHSLDYGISGYDNAFRTLRSYNIVPFGHGSEINKNSVSYLRVGERKVALVGINAINVIPSREEVELVLGAARESSDLQVVYVHWGNEYEDTHNQSQEFFAKELIAAGADLIVGHHPHVVQDIALIDGVPVFYSLGNYIFDQYFSEAVKEGLVLLFTFESEPAIHLIPVDSAVALSQPAPMNQERAEKFLDSLARRSDPLLQSAIRSNIMYLNDFVASSTKMAIIVP